MRAVAALVIVGWFALTGSAGVLLYRGSRHRCLPLAAVLSSVFAAGLALLILTGVLDFLGGAFHRTSVWVELTISTTAVNLALAHACLLFLVDAGTVMARRLQAASMLVVAVAMGIVAVPGAFETAVRATGSVAAVQGLVLALTGVGVAGVFGVWWIGRGTPG